MLIIFNIAMCERLQLMIYMANQKKKKYHPPKCQNKMVNILYKYIKFKPYNYSFKWILKTYITIYIYIAI